MLPWRQKVCIGYNYCQGEECIQGITMATRSIVLDIYLQSGIQLRPYLSCCAIPPPGATYSVKCCYCTAHCNLVASAVGLSYIRLIPSLIRRGECHLSCRALQSLIEGAESAINTKRVGWTRKKKRKSQWLECSNELLEAPQLAHKTMPYSFRPTLTSHSLFSVTVSFSKVFLSQIVFSLLFIIISGLAHISRF